MTPKETIHTSGFFANLTIGSFSFPTYFIVISLVISICIYWTVRRADRFFFPRKHLIDLILAGLFSGILGARLAHVLIEDPSFYLNSPIQVLNLLEGGFVWLGGLVGASFGAILLLRWRRLPTLRWLDFVAPSMAFGYGFGRIACWLTGCCFGRVCQLGQYSFEFPTQLFAVFWEVGVGVFLVSMSRRPRVLGRGLVLATWILLHSLGRIIMEFMRDDLRGPIYIGLGISGWFAVLGVFAAGFWLVRGQRAG